MQYIFLHRCLLSEQYLSVKVLRLIIFPSRFYKNFKLSFMYWTSVKKLSVCKRLYSSAVGCMIFIRINLIASWKHLFAHSANAINNFRAENIVRSAWKIPTRIGVRSSLTFSSSFASPVGESNHIQRWKNYPQNLIKLLLSKKRESFTLSLHSEE